MIRLLNAGVDTLSVITTQNGASVVVSFNNDVSGVYSGTRQLTAITSATTTTIVSTPSSQADVDHINIRNTYAGSHTITVQFNNNGTLHTLVVVTLAQNETLEYTHAGGWHAIDATGAAKVGTAGWVIAAGKIGTLNNSLTFAGTDGTTMTFPSMSGTVATLNTTNVFTVPQTLAAGTVGAPSLTWGDATTGLYRPALNQVGVTINGTREILVESNTTTLNGHLVLSTNSTITIGVGAVSEYTLTVGPKSGSQYIQINAGSTSDSGLLFSDAVGVNPGKIGYDHSTNTLSYRVGGSTVVNVVSTGQAVTGTLSSTGILSTTDATDASNPTTASLKAAGGAAFAKSAIVGGSQIALMNATNGQAMGVKTLTELTTINAAASTDTTIQMPANSIVLAVAVRVTVAVTCTSTFTVGDSGNASRFSTAAVSKAAGSTDKGTAAGAYYNSGALSVRITPDTVPSDATGRLRVVIYYVEVTAPTS